MNILGIETSCDETAAAVVSDGHQLLSSIIATQIDLHAKYGGVVPEIAARSHIEAMIPVVEQALAEAFGPHRNQPPSAQSPIPATDYWDHIDGIAVTAGPGLLGSLLIGVLTAKTLAKVKNKPLYGLNHVEAHVYANFIRTPTYQPMPPKFPLLALIVSGGHSQFVIFRDHLDYTVLGQTRDDAAGEAFDKVAKLLNLGFPGGPAIAKAALKGNELAFAFPKAKLGNDSLDYSFSGLKTAVLRTVQELAGLDHTAPSAGLHTKLTEVQKADLAASFQKTVVDTLVERMLVAYERYRPQMVVIAGGVAANQRLREELKAQLPTVIDYAPMSLCTDNAAMVAALGYYYAKAGKSLDPELLQADSSLAM